jgi:hypothetical protein
MPNTIETLANEIEAALDARDDAKLRNLATSASKPELADALHLCRSRNLDRLNAASAAAFGSGFPLDISDFQARDAELAMLRRLFL